MPRKRRQKGSGSLTLEGRVYWMDVTIKGQRVHESTHTSDQQEAERYLRRRIGELSSSPNAVRGKATIADLCALVVADNKMRQLRDVKGVEWRVERNIKRLVGALRADRFGQHQIRTYIDKRREEGAQNGTLNRELAIIRRGFNLGLREEPPLVSKIPHFQHLENAPPRAGFIEHEQYEILLAAMPNHLKCPLVLAYYFGFRIGEIRKLKWS